MVILNPSSPKILITSFLIRSASVPGVFRSAPIPSSLQSHVAGGNSFGQGREDERSNQLADLSSVKTPHRHIKQPRAFFHPLLALPEKHGLSGMQDYFPVLRGDGDILSSKVQSLVE